MCMWNHWLRPKSLRVAHKFASADWNGFSCIKMFEACSMDLLQQRVFNQFLQRLEVAQEIGRQCWLK